jgi:hypothetical protein
MFGKKKLLKLLKKFLAARKGNLLYWFFTRLYSRFQVFLAARSCSARFSVFCVTRQCERLRDREGVQAVRDPVTSSVADTLEVQIFSARVKVRCCAFEGAVLVHPALVPILHLAASFRSSLHADLLCSLP